MNKVSFLAIVSFLTLAPAAHALNFDFVSDGNPGATVQFNGTPKTFNFAPASTGYDFVIRTSDNAALVGLQGNFKGTFTIGAITIGGGLQSAPVTGTGQFTVFDGTTALTADLVWNSAFSFGTIVGLNDVGLPNLSNVAYTGSNAGLLQLASDINQTASLSTQFLPGKTLTQLTAPNSFYEATYSGSYNSVVPEPTTMLTLLGLATVAARRKRK
jgi:hypothetical protein